MKKRYPKFGISFGNHSDDLGVVLGAVPFEPKDIWFYVKGFESNIRIHPDEFWACPYDNVETLVKSIRAIESALGDGNKTSVNTKGY